MSTATDQQTNNGTAPTRTAQATNLDDARKLLDEMLDRAGPVNAKARVINNSLMGRIQIIEDVLPQNMRGQATRLVKRALMYFNKTPDLMECPPDQFCRCVVQAAELGLMIDGKLCYVVRYKGTFQLSPSYLGLVAVAKRSGQIIDCKPDVVYQHDQFSFQHVNGRDELVHVPNLQISDRGQVVAAYASFILPGGLFRALVMSRGELDKIQRHAPSKGGPWSSWAEEMQKKSAIRRGLKMYCDDPGILMAMEADDDDFAKETVTKAASTIAELDERLSGSNGAQKKSEQPAPPATSPPNPEPKKRTNSRPMLRTLQSQIKELGITPDRLLAVASDLGLYGEQQTDPFDPSTLSEEECNRMIDELAAISK